MKSKLIVFFSTNFFISSRNDSLEYNFFNKHIVFALHVIEFVMMISFTMLNYGDVSYVVMFTCIK